ncbi:UDP-glucose 4-epimerase GalE [Methylocella sp. CPCC 101449]|uniref:UDP-glucose 4-epimerase GalE n=1 Tax=Methylocella sp. CPCC 101449 TaxID=2987531 RepID=UPI00288F1BD4|nr:UDP-glucose 4-epimerase GalE [Methylocella sp. CPCC 101449]MDT2023922.1 UDP-glucose 4-epimerase GalE [Methylocella sp. CPCC 101449]
MTVLVTGGAGYIGSHMVLELLDAGEKVVVLDNLSTGFRWAVPAEVPFVQGDFGDEDLITETLARYDVTAIAHFAAKIVVPESVADPLGYYLNNTAKARSLIESAIEGGVQHFIFSSTAAVYGDPESNPVTEDESLKPVSPYGRSKLMVEWMLQDAAKAHGLRYAVLRYFNVAGADPKGRTGQSTANATHLIKVAVQAALGHRAGMEVFGTDYPTRDGSCLRDYIQVSDLAAAHMDALRYLRGGGDSITCNCGYARGYSVLEVIDVVKKVSGVDFPVTISGRRAGDPAAIVAGNDRIRAVLGWTPKYDDLDVIVRQALLWEQHLQKLRTAAAPSA